MKLKLVELAIWAAIVTAFSTVFAVTYAQSPDPTLCPPQAKSCKVITISPDEEQSLIGPQMIFEHAEWANRAGLGPIVAAWRGKLAGAPAGKAVPEKPAPAEPEKK